MKGNKMPVLWLSDQLRCQYPFMFLWLCVSVCFYYYTAPPTLDRAPLTLDRAPPTLDRAPVHLRQSPHPP